MPGHTKPTVANAQWRTEQSDLDQPSCTVAILKVNRDAYSLGMEALSMLPLRLLWFSMLLHVHDDAPQGCSARAPPH